MNLIANSKIGDCSRCSNKDTAVRKRGKDLVCLFCCRTEDVAKMEAKSKMKNKVRSLITYERTEGILDSQQELILDLDRVTSRMVRLMAVEKDGNIQCFTCSSKKPLKQMHCGHFIPRANLVFRFDWTYNLRPQCPNCNVTLRGNLIEYAKRLNEERPNITEWMHEEARKVYSPSKDELKQMLVDYQQRLNILENKLK